MAFVESSDAAHSIHHMSYPYILSGAGTGTPTGAAQAYFNLNPDVANAYRTEDYGFTANDFAVKHWELFGKNERRVSPKVLGMIMQSSTPRALADAYLVWYAENGNDEANFVSAARALGIPDSLMLEGRNILLNRPPGTAWDGTPPPVTTAPPPPAVVPPPPAPVVADQVTTRSDDFLPPGWARNEAGTVLPAIPRTNLPGLIAPPPSYRDIEPGGGMGPTPFVPLPTPGSPGSSGVIDQEAPSLPLPLLAAGAAVAAFLLARK